MHLNLGSAVAQDRTFPRVPTANRRGFKLSPHINVVEYLPHVEVEFKC